MIKRGNRAVILVRKAETPPSPSVDIARGTTGQLSTNPGTGFRHSGNNPIGQAWENHIKKTNWAYNPKMSINPAVDYARQPNSGNANVDPETVRYSSLRALQRIKLRDQKKGVNAKYDAPSLRNVLSARGVRQDEQHWAGLGEGTATEGKHPIDHWIDHATKHLPRFYSVENPDSAEDFSDYSVWKHLKDVSDGLNMRVGGKYVGTDAHRLGMTHVNSFTATHSDTHPDDAPAEEAINQSLGDKDFYHQTESHPTEIGHYRQVNGPVGLLAHIIPSSHLHNELDPYEWSQLHDSTHNHMQWALEQLAPKDNHWGEHINHATSDEDIDKLIHKNRAFKIPSDELVDILDEMGVDNVPHEVSEQRKLYNAQLSKVSNQLKSWRDRMHSVYEQWPKDGKHEHIEEAQSDYFQHPQAYSPPQGKSTDEYIDELDSQLDPMEREARHRQNNRKQFYKSIGIGSHPNDRTTNNSDPGRSPADLGLEGFPAHSLQELLADMHMRQGLDLSVANNDISNHVNSVADRAIQDYRSGELNIPEASPLSEPKRKQIEENRRDTENEAFTNSVNGLRDHPTFLSNPEGMDRINMPKTEFQYLQSLRGVENRYGLNTRKNSDDSEKFEWPSEAIDIPTGKPRWGYNQLGRRSYRVFGSGMVPVDLNDLQDTLRGSVYGTYKRGNTSSAHAVNGVEIPELHWTRGIINHLDSIGQQISDPSADRQEIEEARGQIKSYLNDLMRPYIDKGEGQLASDIHPQGDEYNLHSTIHSNDRVTRQANVDRIADSIAQIYQPQSPDAFLDGEEFKRLRNLRSKAESLPINRIYPVEQRHLYEAEPLKDNNALERPLRDPETAIRFMVRHAIANAINRGADHISIAPPGEKNGKYEGVPKAGSFWERIGRIRRDEVAKFAREHGAELKDLPWIQGSSVPLFSVNDNMRKHIREHGIHAFDNGLPSTIDRVTKSLSPLSVIIFSPARKAV